MYTAPMLGAPRAQGAIGAPRYCCPGHTPPDPPRRRHAKRKENARWRRDLHQALAD